MEFKLDKRCAALDDPNKETIFVKYADAWRCPSSRYLPAQC